MRAGGPANSHKNPLPTKLAAAGTGGRRLGSRRIALEPASAKVGLCGHDLQSALVQGGGVGVSAPGSGRSGELAVPREAGGGKGDIVLKRRRREAGGSVRAGGAARGPFKRSPRTRGGPGGGAPASRDSRPRSGSGRRAQLARDPRPAPTRLLLWSCGASRRPRRPGGRARPRPLGAGAGAGARALGLARPGFALLALGGALSLGGASSCAASFPGESPPSLGGSVLAEGAPPPPQGSPCRAPPFSLGEGGCPLLEEEEGTPSSLGRPLLGLCLLFSCPHSQGHPIFSLGLLRCLLSEVAPSLSGGILFLG